MLAPRHRLRLAVAQPGGLDLDGSLTWCVPGVPPGDAASGQGRRESRWILDGHVQGGNAEAHRADPLSEIQAHATPMSAAERDVTVADAPSDPDRGDPEPRAFDPPRHDVAHRRSQMTDAEPRLEVLAEVDVGALGSNTEEDAKQRA